MSYKIECPGCKAYSSGVGAAVDRGEPCPFCGLSAAAIAEIDAVRTARADEKLKAELEAAIVARAKAEAELRIVKYRLEQVKEAMEAAPPEWWTS